MRERVRVFAAGHNHQVSITSCPRYYAHPVGVAVMREAGHGVSHSREVQVHQNVDLKTKQKPYFSTPTSRLLENGSIFVPSARALKKDGTDFED